MRWYSSDHHFGHTGIIRLSSRPFADKAEMHDELARRWNRVVAPADDVFYRA